MNVAFPVSRENGMIPAFPASTIPDPSANMPAATAATYLECGEVVTSRLLWALLSAAVLVAGAIAVAPIYMTPAYTPDEAWFGAAAAEMAEQLENLGLWNFARFQSNFLGYGSLYWVGYALLYTYCPDPMLAARGIAFASMMAVPCVAILHAYRTGSPFGWLAAALWFTFPVCWWTGKLTGPDTIALGLGTAGAGLILDARGAGRFSTSLGGLMVGLAIGLKLTTAPLFVFCAYLVGRHAKSTSESVARHLGLLAISVFAGFILANPFLPFHPKHFLRNLALAPSEANFDESRLSFTHLAHLFSNSVWEWDGVFRGGFFNWGLAAPAFVLWGIFVWRSRVDRATITAFSLTLVAMTLLLMAFPRYLGWYWFPVIALIPLVTVGAQARPDRVIYGIALLMLALNLALARPIIAKQLVNQRNQMHTIASGPEVRAAVETRLSEDPRKVDRLVWCLPPGAIRSNGDADPTSAPYKSYYDWEAYTWVHQNRFLTDLEPGERACIVVHRPYRKIWEYVKTHPKLDMADDYDIREVTLDHVDLVYLERR